MSETDPALLALWARVCGICRADRRVVHLSAESAAELQCAVDAYRFRKQTTAVDGPESVDDFCERLSASLTNGEFSDAIEARDNAVANAARLALLASLLTHEQVAYGIPVVTSGVLRAYQEQYTQPKEPTSG